MPYSLRARKPVSAKKTMKNVTVEKQQKPSEGIKKTNKRPVYHIQNEEENEFSNELSFRSDSFYSKGLNDSKGMKLRTRSQTNLLRKEDSKMQNHIQNKSCMPKGSKTKCPPKKLNCSNLQQVDNKLNKEQQSKKYNLTINTSQKFDPKTSIEMKQNCSEKNISTSKCKFFTSRNVTTLCDKGKVQMSLGISKGKFQLKFKASMQTGSRRMIVLEKKVSKNIVKKKDKQLSSKVAKKKVLCEGIRKKVALEVIRRKVTHKDSLSVQKVNSENSLKNHFSITSSKSGKSAPEFLQPEVVNLDEIEISDSNFQTANIKDETEAELKPKNTSLQLSDNTFVQDLNENIHIPSYVSKNDLNLHTLNTENFQKPSIKILSSETNDNVSLVHSSLRSKQNIERAVSNNRVANKTLFSEKSSSLQSMTEENNTKLRKDSQIQIVGNFSYNDDSNNNINERKQEENTSEIKGPKGTLISCTVLGSSCGDKPVSENLYSRLRPRRLVHKDSSVEDIKNCINLPQNIKKKKMTVKTQKESCESRIQEKENLPEFYNSLKGKLKRPLCDSTEKTDHLANTESSVVLNKSDLLESRVSFDESYSSVHAIGTLQDSEEMSSMNYEISGKSSEVWSPGLNETGIKHIPKEMKLVTSTPMNPSLRNILKMIKARDNLINAGRTFQSSENCTNAHCFNNKENSTTENDKSKHFPSHLNSVDIHGKGSGLLKSNTNMIENHQRAAFQDISSEHNKQTVENTSVPTKHGTFKDEKKETEKCPTCDMPCIIGSPKGDTIHLKYHEAFMSCLKFPPWKKQRVLGVFPNGKVVMVLSSDPKFMLKKVELIRKLVDKQLGISENNTSRANSVFILFISYDNKAVGCMIAENISQAYRVVSCPSEKSSDAVDTEPTFMPFSSRGLCCSREPVRALCGISRLWTLYSYRRKKVATHMLDCLRCHFIYGYVLSMDEIAFCDPTADGKQFASKYTKTENFLVFK